jgi:mannosyltransferase OCH1-like enzyme
MVSKMAITTIHKRFLVFVCLAASLASIVHTEFFLPSLSKKRALLDTTASINVSELVSHPLRKVSKVFNNESFPQPHQDASLLRRMSNYSHYSPKHYRLQGPIPHILWFTYKHDVLQTKEPKQYYDNIRKTIDAYRTEWNEPNATVRFLVDDDCKNLLQEVDSRENTTLFKAFEKTDKGDMKADICRVAALYLYGGYYFDIDLEVIQPVILDERVSFSTAQNDAWSGNFFQAFLAATSGHPVLKHNLHALMDYNFGNRTKWKHCKGLMGPCTLLNSWNRTTHRGVNLILKEFNMEEQNYLYPNVSLRGTRRNCHWVVHDADKKVVHFYSRIVGSRWCPEDVPPKKEEKAVNDPLQGLIPHILWFTYEHDLLQTKEPKQYYDNVRKTIDAYRSAWNEPNAEVRFVLDDDCKKLLREVDSKENTTLLNAFEKTGEGPFKADICRVAALYLYGGYYFDVDLEVIQPVILDANVSFSTAQNDAWSGNFFQAFLAATPGHPVLKDNLYALVDYKFGNRTKWQHCNGLMGPCTLMHSWNRTTDRGVNLILKEFNMARYPDRYPNVTLRGTSHACHWVVHDADKKVVHFYSRIVGSRWCPEASPEEQTATAIRV